MILQGERRPGLGAQRRHGALRGRRGDLPRRRRHAATRRRPPASPPPSPPTTASVKVQFRMEVIDADGPADRASQAARAPADAGRRRARGRARLPLRPGLDADQRQRLPHRRRCGGSCRFPSAAYPVLRRRLVPGPPDRPARPGRLARRGRRLLPGARRQQLRAGEPPASISPTCARRSASPAAPRASCCGSPSELGLPHPDRILSLADLANRMVSLRSSPHCTRSPAIGLARPARDSGRRRPPLQRSRRR